MTGRATWPGTAVSNARCSSTSSSPTGTGRSSSGATDLEHGAFGENFTVDGLGDDEVCVGDRYRIGEAEFEVTQPRVTCFRVGMRMGEPQLPSLLVAHHRPGFYLRVITEGRVAAGDEIVRTRRGPHAMSVADIDALLYLPGHDAAGLEAALDIPALSPGWQQSFRSMLESESGTARPDGVAVAPAPSWPGFRSLTVTDVVTETRDREVVPARRRRAAAGRTHRASSSPSGCRANHRWCGPTRCPATRTTAATGSA